MGGEDHTHEHQPESVPLARHVRPSSGSGIPVAPPSVPGNNTRLGQPAGFTDFTSHPHAQTRFHSYPFIFPSGTFALPPNPVAHRMDPQTTLGRVDQSVFPGTRALPDHFPPWSPHTHQGSFPGQYVMPSHTPPFQNQPSPSHGHHLLEFNPLPPTRYFSFPLQQSVPFQHPSNVETSSPSYQHLHRAPPRSSISNPHAMYGTQQYISPPYNSTSHFTPPRHYQPNDSFPWYYGPSFFPLEMSNRNVPPQPHTLTRHVRGDFNAPREQSTTAESLHPPGTSGHSVISTTPQSSVSHCAAASSNLMADPVSVGSPKPDPSHTHHTHHRPSVRRQYHPNSPPNRSEWVMWVGNVPSDATHDELWQFLSQPSVESSADEDCDTDKDNGVLSIFLISRSNCAFVNYQSEQHMNRAISRFNGRSLRAHDPRCPQLVCRARRKEDDLRAGVGAQRGTGVHRHFVKHVLLGPVKRPVGKILGKGKSRAPESSTRGESSEEKETPPSDEVAASKASTQTSSTYPSTTSSLLTLHFPKRFFILKSLTKNALDLGVQRGVWATQKHNKVILDQAFRTSEDVFLIFSINKSGEFYGYARMTSGIFRDSPSTNWVRADSSNNTSSYSRSVSVHATPERHEDLRRGPQKSPPSPKYPSIEASSSTKDPPALNFPRMTRVRRERRSAPPALQREDPIYIDLPMRLSASCGDGGCPPRTNWDSFSSALRSGSDKNNGLLTKARSKGGDVDSPGDSGLHLLPVVEEAHSRNILEEDDPQPESGWGDAFKVEWLNTARISFQQTRHLRNPWNHGREIKISRDGTELEPRVGQQLIEEWSNLANYSSDGRKTDGLVGRTKGNRSRPGRTSKH